MNRTTGLLLAAALLTLIPWSPASAQQASAGNYGWGVGYMTFSPFLEADGDGIAEDLQMEDGLAFAAHAEHWFGWARFFGLQLHVQTTRRPLDYLADTRDASMTSLGGRAMVRFVGGRPKVMPFIGAGAGVTWYGFEDEPDTLVPDPGVVHDAGDDRQLTGLIGAGLDIFPGDSWWWEEVGIRIEFMDHVTLGRPFDLVDGDNDELAHNLSVALSLQASPVW